LNEGGINDKELVRRFYSEYGLEEWVRLVKDPYHQLELDTTMHFIKKYIPKGSLVLDAGGGPGRYTIELAKLGYEVILLDFTPKMLEIAKEMVRLEGVQDKVKQIIEGSIDNLMFRDETFDGVICLNALPHLVDVNERRRAISELRRVARSGAPILISVIGRMQLPIGWLFLWGDKGHETFLKEGFAERLMETGDYYGERGFAPAHFYLPEELEEECKAAGLKVLEMVGLEGLATGHREAVNRLAKEKPAVWKKWLKMHLKLCTHPTCVGLSEHFMIICRK